VQHSIFGQSPSIFNPEGDILDFALLDPALMNGLLALACLGRDMHQETPPSAQCLEFKGRTIMMIRERVKDDASGIAMGTIGAVAALAAFDLLECLGDGRPRPDNMTFLQLAVDQKGGLQNLVKNIDNRVRRCATLQRVILWLDLSYAVLDQTPKRFAFHDSPTHLESIALHSVSLHMTPVHMVFVELSELSRAIDSQTSPSTVASRSFPGDKVFSVEQYITNLDPCGWPQDMMEILRLATFLYSARYLRQYTTNSRFQMGVSERLRVCLDAYLMNVRQTCSGSHLDTYNASDIRAIVLWSTTVAAAASCSFCEIWGRDMVDRRAQWTKTINNMLQHLSIYSICEAEQVTSSLTHDTSTAQSDRRRLLQAVELPP
jgi:hypothetical protein